MVAASSDTTSTTVGVVASPTGKQSLHLNVNEIDVKKAKGITKSESGSSINNDDANQPPCKELSGMKRRREAQEDQQQSMSLRRSRRKVFHPDMVYSEFHSSSKTTRRKSATSISGGAVDQGNHGLLQPDRIKRSEEEKQRIERKHRGVELYRKYMTGARWVYKKPRTMDTFTGYIFLSPHATKRANGKRNYSEGTTQFTGYAAIAKKCEELGEEKFASLVQHGPTKRPGRPRKIHVNSDTSPNPDKIPPVEAELEMHSSEDANKSIASKESSISGATGSVSMPSSEVLQIESQAAEAPATKPAAMISTDSTKPQVATLEAKESSTTTTMNESTCTETVAIDSKTPAVSGDEDSASIEEPVSSEEKTMAHRHPEKSSRTDQEEGGSASLDGARVENWFSEEEEEDRANVPRSAAIDEAVQDDGMGMFSPFSVVSPSSAMEVAALPLDLWDEQQYELPPTTETGLINVASTSSLPQLSNHSGGKLAILKEKMIRLENFFLKGQPRTGILRDRVTEVEEAVGATTGRELLTVTGRISSLGMIHRRIVDLEGPPKNPDDARAQVLIERVEKEIFGQAGSATKSLLVRLQDLEAEF